MCPPAPAVWCAWRRTTPEADESKADPPMFCWRVATFADLSRIPADWWTNLTERVNEKFGRIKITHRKMRHAYQAGGQSQVPYEVVVRGPEVHLAFDEVLDSLVMEYPDVITIEDLEGFPLPAMKAGLTAECQDTAGVWHATVVETRLAQVKADFRLRNAGPNLLALPADVQVELPRRRRRRRRRQATVVEETGVAPPTEAAAETSPQPEAAAGTTPPEAAAETTPPEAEADVTAEQQQQQAERRRVTVIVTLKKKESEWARSNANVVRSLLPDFGAWKYKQHVREAAASFEMWEENARTVGEAGLTAEVGTPLVVLCVTTYKRTFQLMRSLPVNLCVTFPRRDRVIWIIVNFQKNNIKLPEKVLQKVASHLRSA